MEMLKTLWKFIKNAKYMKGFNQKTIATFSSIENPVGDYHVMTLKPAPGFSWETGEHIILRIPNNEALEKDYKVLSISSTKEEGNLLFGFRTGKETSPFKKALMSLKEGDPLSVQGAFGWFRVRDDSSPIVMFAGGIGVTPIRALVKELANSQTRPIHIVFSSMDYYLFDNEIQDIVDKNPSMTLHKVSTPEETQDRLTKLALEYKNQAYYFLSASPAVVDSVAKLLRSKGIASKRLIDDSMKGY